ncbi:MAG: TIM barrel protein [Candidatus Hydrogenedentota bacterium]
MRIIYGKTNWECKELSLDAFMERVVADGFDVAELYVPGLVLDGVTPAQVAKLVADRGLLFIADIATEGDTPADHLDSFNRYADFALEAGAILINAHTSRDFFPFEETLRIFERGLEIAKSSGIPVAHETHRSRALYNAIDTRRYLEALPNLRINADFSHWFNVHESDLSDQPDTIDLAISRAIHIHARVGHEEGPQVNDPRAPEWSGHLQKHIDLWKRIVAARQADGTEVLTITPEFGPLADCWEVNVFMRDTIRDALKTS